MTRIAAMTPTSIPINILIPDDTIKVTNENVVSSGKWPAELYLPATLVGIGGCVATTTPLPKLFSVTESSPLIVA